MRVKYALCGETQRREMDVIAKAWALMSDLDTPARARVVSWLQSWVRYEAPEGETELVDF